ncbi:BZ3500_MvSof-1268-A1-R1_Chr1-1g01260 [Microbotryum saponariae]|uniref:BZ3500_MvSof-1268-A1-R1_Chr1-1g01260 protein n=1 Tax=Microbotryum saponariae TaxID=289078 RepID=A0A2X0KLW1_9BASI|nr:BZ3500_MvSof-1268-A1-R1_Chr1-1g01260 [Microbotryum saponariae]SCZ93817.1 BZ3501_MvSof-1269-A2-R1_Chr1-1g00856 [Microbotryum saponariae]
MRSFFVIVAVVCTVGSALATSATPTQPTGFKKLRRSSDAEVQLEAGERLHTNW